MDNTINLAFGLFAFYQLSSQFSLSFCPTKAHKPKPKNEIKIQKNKNAIVFLLKALICCCQHFCMRNYAFLRH